MALETVIQVVSQLPPTLGGVGGYAVALARGLRDHGGVETRFLVTDPDWPTDGWSEPGITVRRLERHTAGLLRHALTELTEGGRHPALLHYANYGYERRGCPLWLLGGIARWRAAGPSRLVTFFHEVYASGPPRSSAFWLSPVQKSLAARLLRASDRSVTSLPLYARLLTKLVPGASPMVHPVLSPLGEPADPPPLAARRRDLVVFGGPGARSEAYGLCRETLEVACRELEIEEIVDVGSPLPDGSPLPREIAGRPVRAAGPLPDAEASALLCSTFAGFIAHQPQFLGKSTIFSSLGSHAVLPVGRREKGTGQLVWTPGDPASPAALQTVATAVRTWYLGHSAPRLSAAFHELLFP
jgi:hypothetical protein